MRIGQGVDVHRFEKGTAIILGGVEIPYEKGLKGHSDADVITHALIDALLGAAGKGDIGRHFPDNDERYRNISSLKLLRQVINIIAPFHVVNVDITLIGESPRIAPYAERIRQNYAEIMEIAPDCVNVKGTTTEGLGFTGQKEGLSAVAVVSLDS